MALTASEISQVYEMLGIPQGGSAMAIDNLATMFGPFAQAYDFTAIITLIDAKLAALSATNIVRVQTLLTEYTTIGATDPLLLVEGISGKGRIVDYNTQRENIHKTLCGLIGVQYIFGGFMAELRRRGGNNCQMSR